MGRTQRYAGGNGKLTTVPMLETRVTHLEMRRRPPRVAMPTGPRLALMRAPGIPPAFYRWLYEQVGRPHHWQMRRGLDDAALRAAIHDKAVEITVLYCDGAPAGFFEIRRAHMPAAAEIVYFGLLPDFQGRGLARYFLSEAVHAAFAHEPEKITLQTNTLDSPHALLLYQKAGFQPVGWSVERIEAWE